MEQNHRPVKNILTEAEDGIPEEQKNIPQHVIVTLINYMPNSIAAVVRAFEGNTSY